jgi:hypothetical protein
LLTLNVKGGSVRQKIIEELSYRDIGVEEYEKYSSLNSIPTKDLSEAVIKTLENVSPSFGSCVMISAALVTILKIDYSISAIAVLGDLKIKDNIIFKCNGNIPTENKSNEPIIQSWGGHCWVEVAGIICDLSIFRTAYRINKPSVLKEYVLKTLRKLPLKEDTS